jgi:hypothetical protein
VSHGQTPIIPHLHFPRRLVVRNHSAPVPVPAPTQTRPCPHKIPPQPADFVGFGFDSDMDWFSEAGKLSFCINFFLFLDFYESKDAGNNWIHYPLRPDLTNEPTRIRGSYVFPPRLFAQHTSCPLPPPPVF